MTHEEAVAAIRAIRTGNRRATAAKAAKRRNYALALERMAASDEEWQPMLMAAERLRQIADEIQAE